MRERERRVDGLGEGTFLQQDGQKMWYFEGYTVFEESDVLRFEDNQGNLLGYVTLDATTPDYDLIEELNNGEDPIEEGWEDGIGNTISLEGWAMPYDEWAFSRN